MRNASRFVVHIVPFTSLLFIQVRLSQPGLSKPPPHGEVIHTGGGYSFLVLLELAARDARQRQSFTTTVLSTALLPRQLMLCSSSQSTGLLPFFNSHTLYRRRPLFATAISRFCREFIGRRDGTWQEGWFSNRSSDHQGEGIYLVSPSLRRRS